MQNQSEAFAWDDCKIEPTVAFLGKPIATISRFDALLVDYSKPNLIPSKDGGMMFAFFTHPLENEIQQNRATFNAYVQHAKQTGKYLEEPYWGEVMHNCMGSGCDDLIEIHRTHAAMVSRETVEKKGKPV